MLANKLTDQAQNDWVTHKAKIEAKLHNEAEERKLKTKMQYENTSMRMMNPLKEIFMVLTAEKIVQELKKKEELTDQEIKEQMK